MYGGEYAVAEAREEQEMEQRMRRTAAAVSVQKTQEVSSGEPMSPL